MSGKPVKTLHHAGCRIEIHQDDTADNPVQQWDGQAKVQIWHRGYDFGNDHTFNTPQEVQEYFRRHRRQVVFLPVFMYDHSGITVNTTGFSCPWDSGQVGYCWCSRDDAEEALGTRDREAAYRFLRETVQLLDDYLTGNVYGYVVLDPQTSATIDSCWGYFGDPEVSGLLDDARAVAEQQDQQVREAARASLAYAI